MQEKLNKLQNNNNETTTELQEELEKTQKECNELKTIINKLQQELTYEKEKLKSLEITMQNITSGNSELIEREQKAAEERAIIQRQKDEEYNNNLKSIEEKNHQNELKYKTDINNLKIEFTKRAEGSKLEYDQIKKAKDREIDTLAR